MKKLPAALVVGLALFVIYNAGNALFAFASSYYAGVRWTVASRGMDLVMHALIAVGLLELARSTRTPAMRIAAWLFACAAAWLWVSPLIELGWSTTSWYFAVMGHGFVLMGMVMTASALAFIVAADGLRRAPVAAVLVVVAVLGYGWMPFVGKPFHEWLAEHRGIAAIYWLVQGGLFVAGTARLARVVSPDEAAIDPRAAASGLRIFERALKLRVVLALVISAGALRTLSNVVSIGASVALVGTLVIAALGCMRLARANLVGFPSAIGGALVMWWGASQLVQLTLSAFPEEFTEAWMTAGPIVGVAGFALVGVCVLEALPSLRQKLTSRLVVFVTLSIISIAIVTAIDWSYDTQQSMMIVAGVAGITGLLALASLARTAADAIGKTDLPEARVVSTSQP